MIEKLVFNVLQMFTVRDRLNLVKVFHGHIGIFIVDTLIFFSFKFSMFQPEITSLLVSCVLSSCLTDF